MQRWLRRGFVLDLHPHLGTYIPRRETALIGSNLVPNCTILPVTTRVHILV